jgi:hypothetical protein
VPAMRQIFEMIDLEKLIEKLFDGLVTVWQLDGL